MRRQPSRPGRHRRDCAEAENAPHDVLFWRAREEPRSCVLAAAFTPVTRPRSTKRATSISWIGRRARCVAGMRASLLWKSERALNATPKVEESAVMGVASPVGEPDILAVFKGWLKSQPSRHRAGLQRAPRLLSDPSLHQDRGRVSAQPNPPHQERTRSPSI